MHAYNAGFFTLLVEILRRLDCRLATRADCNNDPIRIGRAVIIEKMMFASGELCDVRHCLLDNIRQLIVILIDGLADLEIHVGIGCGAANDGMIRIERAAAEGIDRIVIDE